MRMKLLYLLLIVVLLCSCSSQADLREQLFVEKILEIPTSGNALFVRLNTMEELITVTKANLVVKCKVLSRSDAVVYDPFGIYSDEMLESSGVDEKTKQGAINCIATPYNLQITDVYLGESYTDGDSIPYYAPYGFIGEYQNRMDGYPIIQVGSEYILFLRVDNICGEWVYYPAHPQYSFMKLRQDLLSIPFIAAAHKHPKKILFPNCNR